MGVDEHTIDLAGMPAFYRSAPRPGAPVLYLHGVPTSSDDWAELLAQTGGIAPDLPGFGRTGKAGNLDYSLGGLAGFIERLLAVLGVDQVDLVGHQWGAAAGLAFAQRHPARIRRIVLCNPLPLAPDFDWPRVARVLRTPLLGELAMGFTTKALLARVLRRACAGPEALPDARIDAIWDQFDQGTQRAILRLHRSIREPRPDRIDTRTLILWGERDPWFPPEVADAYAQAMPHATVEKLRDAGHWPWLDRPELANNVRAFLEGQ